MFQQLQGVQLDKPLFAILTASNTKEAVLFGEDIWRWRAQVYRNDQNFQRFDDFIGSLMVYLGSNKQRNRLELDYELVFDNASMAKIRLPTLMKPTNLMAMPVYLFPSREKTMIFRENRLCC